MVDPKSQDKERELTLKKESIRNLSEVNQQEELGSLQLQPDSVPVQRGEAGVPTRNTKKQNYMTSPKEHNFPITNSKDGEVRKISDGECKGLLVKNDELLIISINC